MGDETAVYIEATIKEGQREAVRTALTKLGADAKQNEPGTLFYRSFVEGDRLVFMDVYASPETFLTHLGRDAVQTGLGEILPLIDIKGFNVLGNTTDDLRGALKDFNPSYAETFTGFTRLDGITVGA